MESTNKKALKAGGWYVVCTFLTKGIYVITTPIFTRILSKDDYGVTTTYNSWLSLLSVICTLDLYSCIQLAKVEFEENSRKFLSSIMVLSTLSVTVFYVILKTVSHFGYLSLGIPDILVDILFAEILFRNAYTLYQTYHRVYLKYKEFTFLTILTTIAGQALAVIFVYIGKNHAYIGRILGTAIPMAIVGLILLTGIIAKERVFFNKEYWSMGLKVSVPLIPHNLSGYILTNSDRIIITYYAGVAATAVYGIASDYALVVSTLWSAVNRAWGPWFYEKMKNNALEEIYSFSKMYTAMFAIIVIFAGAFGPEAIWFLGGSSYLAACDAIPPIVIGIMFQFLYSLYANIEFYYKKTSGIAIWTVLAATANIILNIMLIPHCGYVAAGYTTLIGYILMFILHRHTAGKIETRTIYDEHFILWITLGTAGCVWIMYLLYDYLIIRILLIIAIAGLFIYRYRDILFAFFKGRYIKKP